MADFSNIPILNQCRFESRFWMAPWNEWKNSREIIKRKSKLRKIKGLFVRRVEYSSACGSLYILFFKGWIMNVKNADEKRGKKWQRDET